MFNIAGKNMDPSYSPLPSCQGLEHRWKYGQPTTLGSFTDFTAAFDLVHRDPCG